MRPPGSLTADACGRTGTAGLQVHVQIGIGCPVTLSGRSTSLTSNQDPRPVAVTVLTTEHFTRSVDSLLLKPLELRRAA
jgi:hypothetical protein